MPRNISFKEFMDQVEIHLNTYSQDALRNLILEWAKNIHPSKRTSFLASLVPESSAQTVYEPDSELLTEINELAKKVENGDYCDGWGWDDDIQEEREWGDESWAYEVDDFFSRAGESLTEGQYKLARDAYDRLFDILDMGQDGGHLPGCPDPLDMLESDLGETKARFLRSVYLSTPPEKRAAELLQAMQRFDYYIGDDLNLRSVVNIERNPLPDFTNFLSNWIDLLKETSGSSASYLLREAVMLLGGTPAIAKLARDEGNRYPKAYIDWISALEKEGDFRSMLQAAKEGLNNIPIDYVVRAEIAKGMVRSGEHMNDSDIQLMGWHEAFYSDPSLSNLLSLFSIAEQKGCNKEEIEAAINRVESLNKENKIDYSFAEFESHKSKTSESILNQAYILAGRYEDVYDLCKGKEVLGWSGGSNPKGLAIPFFLILLSKGTHLYPGEVLKQQWKEALSNFTGLDYRENRQDVAERFEKTMNRVFRSVQLSGDEENKYMLWCIKQVGMRIDAIVGEKHRMSYHKAAKLLVALAEVHASRNTKQEGFNLIEKYRQKYSRYPAFRQELGLAVKESNIFAKNP